MKFIINKEARAAYFIADSLTDEMSVKTIFLYLHGPFPNNCNLIPGDEKIFPFNKFCVLEILDGSCRRE